MHGKLGEIKLEAHNPADKVTNITQITQENLVESMEQSRKKLKILFARMKEDPRLFTEAMDHVHRGGLGGNQARQFRDGPKGNFFSRPKEMDKEERLQMKQMNMQNVRVKLPNQAEDEASDMSIEDPEAEKQEERIERMKIKHQAEMRKSK